MRNLNYKWLISLLVFVIVGFWASIRNGVLGSYLARSTNPTFPIIIDRSVATHRENAALMVLCRNNDLYALLETIQLVQDRFNWQFNYDWVFLNDEPFTLEFIDTVSARVDKGSLKFGLIDPSEWGFPPHINQTLAAEKWALYEQENIPYGGSELYRHMCRFFSGFFYNHPLMLPYDYYWRIEPGVKYYCDIDYDIFEFMAREDILYGFTISMFEYADTIPSLWNTFKDYMHVNDYAMGGLTDFVQNNDGVQSYNLCHFWTNFEIAHLSVFRNSKYQRYFEYLDRAGGFYYERWGDAPVHTMFILSFLEPEDVWWFGDFGYFHAPYLLCPKSDQIRTKGKCSCNPKNDFLFTEYSCTSHFLNLKLQLEEKFTSHLDHT